MRRRTILLLVRRKLLRRRRCGLVLVRRLARARRGRMVRGSLGAPAAAAGRCFLRCKRGKSRLLHVLQSGGVRLGHDSRATSQLGESGK